MTLRDTSLSAVLAFVGVITLAAAPASEAPSAANATGLVVEHALGTATVPTDVATTSIFTYDVLDSLDLLGIDVAALPKATLPPYLSRYAAEEYVDAGTLFEPDFETLFDVASDVIFISARQADLYDDFTDLAPTVYVTVDTADYLDSMASNARLLGEIYGVEERVEEHITSLTSRATAIAEASEGSTTLFVMVSDGALSVFGPGSRFDVAFSTLGFESADPDIEVSRHGQSISFEYLVEFDPDYLFVLDRGAAVTGTGTAASVLDNPLVRGTTAYRNGRVAYLSSAAWYLASGGLQASDTMFADIEQVLFD